MSAGGQIEKPRFFIDLLQYQYEIGNIGCITDHTINASTIYPNLIGLSPTRKYNGTSSADQYRSVYIGFKHPISIPSTDMFIAMLGHQFKNDNFGYKVVFNTFVDASDTSWLNQIDAYGWESLENICNGSEAGSSPDYDGWSISKFTPSNLTNEICMIRVLIKNDNWVTGQAWNFNLGNIALGMIYEPEFHTDLSVTQSRIMDGVKNKQTKGGSTYSVINYTKPPNWWTGSPFELTDPSVITSPVAFSNARIGRRSWDVGFSQLSDRFYTDGVPNGVFPANDMVNRNLPDTVNGNYSEDEDYYTSDEGSKFNYNINNDTSLYSTVYHHTLGGTLPFLFSPSPDNSPQNFAVCRFDKPGFSVTQKSYKKFNVKMKINESW